MIQLRRGLAALAVGLVGLVATPALAQDGGTGLAKSAFATCREAQGMAKDARVAFVMDLVQRASGAYGVAYGEGTPLDSEVATLLRSGCTVFPDAYVLSMTAAAVRRAGNVPTPTGPVSEALPFEQAVFVTCAQYAAMTDAQQDDLEYTLAVVAGQRYGVAFGDAPADRAKFDEGITPLVHGSCRLAPEFLVYAVVARAVAASVAPGG